MREIEDFAVGARKQHTFIRAFQSIQIKISQSRVLNFSLNRDI